MRTTRRIVGTAMAAAVVAALVGAPAGTTRARAAAAERADAAAARLTADGVPVVVDGYVPPDADCDMIAHRIPLFEAGAIGASTPREAVLAHATPPATEEDVDPSMTVVEIGRVSGEEYQENWTLVHVGGSVTTLRVGPAPGGGWIVQGSETCVVRPT